MGNNLLYEKKITKYIAALYIFVHKYNKNQYLSKDFLLLLSEKNDRNIELILNKKMPIEFSRNQLGYLNQLNIFKDGKYYIPQECFSLLKRSLLINKEDKFILSFNNEYDYKIFNNWKNIERFNNFLYEDNDGLLKEIINKGLKENLLEEINLDNKIKISYILKKTQGITSKAKQYKYYDKEDGLITLIYDKKYINFYDIFQENVFLNEEECLKNITEKVKQIEIIKKMNNHNIYINNELLKQKIKEYFFNN